MATAAAAAVVAALLLCSANGGLVWPRPRFVEPLGHGESVGISSRFQIYSPAFSASPELRSAARRSLRWVLARESSAAVSSRLLFLLNVTVAKPGVDLQPGVDESYELVIPASGGVGRLSATTIWGAIHGLETLTQLIVRPGPSVSPVHVRDWPLYPHRGIMLDTARNFYPVASLLRTIAAMGFNKLNVFHWHLTDSHSFPIELRSEPRLAAAGSYGPGFSYTAADVAQVIAYARRRAVRVVPEVDVPGHAASWGAAYPDIVTCLGQQWWDPNVQKWADRMASEPGAGQLNPLLDKTYDVVNHVIDEVASLFPDSWYHSGGDEVAPACWNASTDVAAYLAAGGTAGDLLSRFLSRSHDRAARLNHKTVVYWEDALLDAVVNVTGDVGAVLPPATTVIQTWRGGAATTKAVTSRGYRAVVSSAEFLYLDCGHGAFLLNDSRTDQSSATVVPPSLAITGDAANYNYGGTGGSWCAPFKSWSRIYDYDLTLNLTATEASLVLGAEVALWSEQADETVLDARLWPRAAALAELVWSGNRAANGVKRTAQAGQRLLHWRERLVSRGIAAEPMMPRWCLFNPRLCKLNV